MLQAFKLADGTLVPFTSVQQAGKDSRDRYLLNLIITGRDRANSFYFKSAEDRDQQFANFETWLTLKQNSI